MLPLKWEPVLAMIGVLCLVTPFCLVSPVSADISLPMIFSDHMVLQQNSSVKVWGTAEAEQKLIVRFNKTKTAIQADVLGRWSTRIQTPAAGGPYELEIAAEVGEPKVIFTDVMVGEVWICSGQSNMEWPVSKSRNPNSESADSEIEESKNFPNLRLYTVGRNASPQPIDDFSKVTPWTVCSPESVGKFSAVAYFFGREISQNLDSIPIGLIHTSWGGTRAEAWTSRAAMDQVQSLGPLLRHWDENDDPTSQQRPGNLFNGMIAPMTDFKVRGVLWYQGESNNGRGHQYATLFPTLINDWRSSFKEPNMPFYFVQLAPFRYQNQPNDALAEVWDAQLKTLKSVDHTQMVVTTDIGNIKDIHPTNKQEVGRRLALVALGDLYNDQLPLELQDGVFNSPIYEAMAVQGNQIRLTFKNTGEGLQKRSDDEALNYFTISGTDQNFVPATATIKGDAVIVASDEVAQPVAVRFAWTDTAEPNLVNSAGLPASPFRTDDFPLESVEEDY